jgi:hypothetical protein
MILHKRPDGTTERVREVDGYIRDAEGRPLPDYAGAFYADGDDGRPILLVVGLDGRINVRGE